MLHPSQNGGVCEVDAALAHHGNQIAIAQLEAQIPPNTQNHDLLVKMPTFEQLLDRYESWHPSIIVDIGCRLHQSRLVYNRPMRFLRREKSRERIDGC
jgi:hypothetical protein